MNNPLISVIIPIYNSEKYLKMTLQSVQKQTLKNFEAICVNDGSTDNSLQIIQEFASSDNRFKIFNQKNKGGSISRNNGLTFAKGKYIAFLDNDDIYHPQYLEILYNNLKVSGADISCCSYLRFNSEENYVFPNTAIIPHIDFISVTPFRDKFVKRKKIDTLMWVKLYKKTLFSDTKFAESLPAINDMLLNIEMLLKAKKIVVCYEKLIAYRIINTSQTMKPLSSARIEEYKNLAIEINKLTEQYPSKKTILQKIATKYAYGQCIKEYLQRYNPQEDTQNYNHLRETINNLMKNKYISVSFLSLRKKIIIWAFLHKKFGMLNLIKEKK